MKQTVVAHDLAFEPFLSPETIDKRVRELGREIEERYRGKNPLFLAVLNGAFIFASDLVRACGIDCEISFIRLASYQGSRSSGEVKKVIGLKEDVRDRPVIIVEDIVDSGRTLTTFLPDLEKMGPASIEIATLLLKPEMIEFPIHVDYVGFEIPPRFVIGYGLDYDGQGRNFPGIYQLSKPEQNQQDEA